jgi:predicted N-formylglutamate amidohydrolase
VRQAGAESVTVDPVAIENVGGAGRFVIACDHASNRLPAELGTLGLSAESLDAHIAWDPGALGVSRALSRRLDAPLIHPTVSRLVIDCNRPLDAPDLIPATSETTAIPGNADLTDAERRRRIAAVHEPYHRALEVLIEERLAAGLQTALVAIHSFTPIFHGAGRPWEVGVVFDRDRRLADPMIDALKAKGLYVGVNEPYGPTDRVYTTMHWHGEARGLACVMIEIRNDLIRDESEQAEWGERIGAHLASNAAVTSTSREPSV